MQIQTRLPYQKCAKSENRLHVRAQSKPQWLKYIYDDLTNCAKLAVWCRDLEADAAVDPGAARVLEGANGDPKRVLENIRAEQAKLKIEDLVQQRTGMDAAINVRFRDIDPQNLWIWFEFYSSPSVTDKELLSEVLNSWFMIGKLGGYNAANLQISHGMADNVDYFKYDKERSSETLDSFLHELSDLEVKELWGRIKVDMGTADELCLDILINMISTFSKDYVGIKNLIFGGQNKDWPVSIDIAPPPLEDSELEQKVTKLAKSLGKSKDDKQKSTPSISHLFGEDDLKLNEAEQLFDDLIGDSIDLNDGF